jgi:hypothetical protein
MIKKGIILILFLVVLYCFYNPIVLQFKNAKPSTSINLKTNQLYKLKDFVNIDDIKNSKVYIVLNSEEIDYLHPNISKYKILKSDNVNLINDLFNCEFKYTGSDVATIQSKIYIYTRGVLVFESGISLDTNSQGLQNNQFGWVEPVKSDKFINIITQFKRYNSPILIIN